MAKWQNSTPHLIEYISEQSMYLALLKILREDVKLADLMCTLFSGGEPLDPLNTVQEYCQQLGLAKVEERDGKKYIAIKSELIKGFVRRYSLKMSLAM